MQRKSIYEQQVGYWGLLFLVVSVMLPELAHASSTPLSNTICVVIQNLQGDIARGVAAVGIIFLGFSLFLGKVTWGVALALGIGIGAIFGAGQLVNILGTEGAFCNGIIT